MALNQIMTGLGSPEFYEPTKKYLFPVPPMRFQVTADSESVQSLKFENGILVTAGSLQKSASFKLEFEIQATSWLALQFCFGELEQTIDPKSIPELKYATVPTSAPFEIAVPDLQTAIVAVTVIEDGSSGTTKYKQGQRVPASTAATPAAGQFGADLAGKKLIFNAADAGAPIAYRYLKDYTAIRSLGAGPNPFRFEAFSFSGVGYFGTDKAKIVIPNVARSSLPALGFTGDVGSLTVSCGLIPKSGQSLPFELYNMADLTATQTP